MGSIILLEMLQNEKAYYKLNQSVPIACSDLGSNRAMIWKSTVIFLNYELVFNVFFYKNERLFL